MRVVLMQNFVAPYRVPLYEALAARLDAFRVLVSVPMEPDRDWAVEWGGLDVRVQRTVTLRRPYRDPLGFTRVLQVHVPLDTLPRLLRFRPDGVVSVELGARSLQALAFKLLRPRTRLVLWCKLSEHSERAWGPARRALRRLLLARADAVLVNGESGARYVRGFGVPDRRIHRLNQPVDVARFSAVPRERDEGLACRLLCAGTLTARKGVEPFLRALIDWARAHPERDVELWWLGDGDARASLEASVLPPNLRQHFCGSLPYADVPAVYARCDLLVFPSLLDEWGLVVNEAMAAGLPVLGSVLAQAVTELVEEGRTGWRFDPREDATLRDALARALDIPPGRMRAMRAAARARIAGVTPEDAARRIALALAEPEAGGPLPAARRALPLAAE